MDDYLVGVLRAEMPASFELEALKAQAIAARTYTLYKMEDGPIPNHPDADACDDINCCKAYKTAEDAAADWGSMALYYEEKLARAVGETDGQVVLYGGEPILAVFCSSTNGHTQNAGAVWQSDLPYLQSVSSPENEELVPNYYSVASFSADEFRARVTAARPDAALSGSPENWIGNIARSDAGFVTNVIKTINDKGIPVRFTFTNPVLTESDLDDPFCNFCMRAGDNGMNQVLVFSPILEDYIRRTYPGYRIDSSTCKEIRDISELEAELERDYTYVVLDYNLNNDFALLESLPHKDKIEILLNAICEPHCKRRGEHYVTIGKNQKIAVQNRKLPPDKQIKPIPWYCDYGENNTFATIQKYPTFVSADAIWEEYVPRGINNFKIEGRTANMFMLVEEYTYYMIRPEHQSEVRLMILHSLEKSHILSINRPKPSPFIDPGSEAVQRAPRRV